MLYEPDERAKAEEFVPRMVKRAIEMEGYVSGEHGVGLVKYNSLPHQLGTTNVDAMRRVRICSLPRPRAKVADPLFYQVMRAFDPLYLVDYDKIIRVGQPLDKLK